MIDLKLLFEAGRKAGLSEMEVYLVEDESFSCKVFKQMVDSYSVSVTRGLSFRGLYQGKMGYTYTEKCDNSSIEFLIVSVIANATMIEKDDREELYAGDNHYVTLDLYHSELEAITAKDKIEFLKAVEAECLALDPRVKSVNYCLFANGTTKLTLKNSKGLDLQQYQNYAYSYVSILVSEHNENKTEGDYIISTDFKQYDPKSFAQKLVSAALSQLGATKIKSGLYPILLKNKVAGSILAAMSDCFSAESVQKDLSRLKGKLEDDIASSLVTIIDDPHLKDGLNSAAFDGEGVATYPKEVVAAGILKTYFHSLATAKTFKVRPTGNGFRSGFKSPVAISPSNMYIKPHKTSFDQLTGLIKDGIYITDVQGLHAGLNSISGDFSLSANGFLIKNGQISTPIHEMTVAGNFFDLLQKVKGISHDLHFGASNFGSPSLWIESLTVAGE